MSQTHRQDRLQYTALQLASAQCNNDATNNVTVRCIWSLCAFDQMCCAFWPNTLCVQQTRCAFGQLCKPNLTLTLKLTLTQTLSLTQILVLTVLQVRCAIDQILHTSTNAVQLINWSAAQRIWSNGQLAKCVLHNHSIVVSVHYQSQRSAITKMTHRQMDWWNCYYQLSTLTLPVALTFIPLSLILIPTQTRFAHVIFAMVDISDSGHLRLWAFMSIMCFSIPRKNEMPICAQL